MVLEDDASKLMTFVWILNYELSSVIWSTGLFNLYSYCRVIGTIATAGS